MTKLMAVDPGGLTGIAWCEAESPLELRSVTLMGYPGWDALLFVVRAQPDVLIVERFQTGGRLSADGLRTIELVGALQGWAVMAGVLYVMHTPSMRHPWQKKAETAVCTSSTDAAVLGAIGSVRKGRTRHEDDALAHLLLHLQLGTRGLTNNE